MKKNNKQYIPYFKESIYQFFSVSCALIIGIVVLIAVDVVNLMGIVIIAIIVMSMDLVLNHLVSILAIFDIMFKTNKTSVVHIKKIKVVISFTGKYDNAITTLYPEEQRVDKYRLICITDDGKKLILRSVMSGKKRQIISDIVRKDGNKSFNITYGRFSHIIISYNGKDDLSKILTRRF